MNENTASADTLSDTVKEPEQEPAPTPARGNKAPLFFSLLAILALGAAVVFGYPYWQQLQTKLSNMQQQLTQTAEQQQTLKNQLKTNTALTKAHDKIMLKQEALADKQLSFLTQQEQAFKQQDQKIAIAKNSMLQREQQLNQAIVDVRKLSGKPDNRWMIAEAEYLIQLANSRLTLALDPDTAQVALTQAAQRLAATKDPQWDVVRKQLSKDSTALGKINIPALLPLVSQLEQLKKSIKDLKLANHPPPSPDKTTPTIAAVENPGLQQLGSKLWQGFKASIRIRRNDKPIQPMLAPQQSLLLYQNLELMLESAHLALLQRETVLFQQALLTAKQWTQEQFSPKHPNSIKFLQQLQKLSTQELQPKLPDISRTLGLLHSQQQQAQP